MVTPIGTLSFPALYEPDRYSPDSNPRYKAELIFDEGEDITAIQQELARAVQKQWPEPKDRPAGLMDKWPIKRDDEGTLSLRTASKYRPRVFDSSMNQIDDPSVMYAGCRVKIGGYAHTYGDGVSFILREVQRVADGEPIVGTHESEFGAVDDEQSEFSGAAGSDDDPLNALLTY